MARTPFRVETGNRILILPNGALYGPGIVQVPNVSLDRPSEHYTGGATAGPGIMRSAGGVFPGLSRCCRDLKMIPGDPLQHTGKKEYAVFIIVIIHHLWYAGTGLL